MTYRTYIAASKAAYLAALDAGISAQELRAHTGVIGEAFVADYLGVPLASNNNQKGFDLIDGNGLRVSVKTITTSSGIRLHENTMNQVDRVVVAWLDTREDQLNLFVVYDKHIHDCIQDCSPPKQGKLRLGRNKMSIPELIQ